MMKESFDEPGREAELYRRLAQERNAKELPTTAELKK